MPQRLTSTGHKITTAQHVSGFMYTFKHSIMLHDDFKLPGNCFRTPSTLEITAEYCNLITTDEPQPFSAEHCSCISIEKK
jgi:hypothetical protein